MPKPYGENLRFLKDTMSTINEILKAAEDNPKSIMNHMGNKYLRSFMEAAYLTEKKLTLPEGDPPFKTNLQHEFQVPSGVFWQFAKKIDLFQRPDIGPKLEQQFILQLESMSEVEAKIVLAAKDQKLNKMFKGLTLKVLKEVGYFPA